MNLKPYYVYSYRSNGIVITFFKTSRMNEKKAEAYRKQLVRDHAVDDSEILLEIQWKY